MNKLGVGQMDARLTLECVLLLHPRMCSLTTHKLGVGQMDARLRHIVYLNVSKVNSKVKVRSKVNSTVHTHTHT
jgi:hypothetical protein